MVEQLFEAVLTNIQAAGETGVIMVLGAEALAMLGVAVDATVFRPRRRIKSQEETYDLERQAAEKLQRELAEFREQARSAASEKKRTRVT